MTDYKTVFQLAQDKGLNLLRCKHCGNIELNCLKDGLCTSCFCYNETPTTQWAKGVDTNLLILTIIQKWLRDEHKIEMFIATGGSDIQGRYYSCIIPECYIPKSPAKEEYLAQEKHPNWNCSSYEEALLFGTHEVLKLI